MAALFDCTVENVIIHLKNILTDGELDENSVTKDFLVTVADRKNYRTKYYNFDTIIDFSYRYTQPSERQRMKVPLLINTKQATAFQQWAMVVLRDYVL